MKKIVVITFLSIALLSFQTGCAAQRPLLSEESGLSGENTFPGESQNETFPGGVGNSSSETPGASSRDFEAIKARLSGYSNDLNELSVTDSYVLLHGQQYSGLEYWDSFYSDIQNLTPSELTMIQFTVEGDAILYYLNYDGSDFYMVTDYSRDAFSGDDDKYREDAYSCLKVFDTTVENGDYERTLILTDDKDLTLEQYKASAGAEAWDGFRTAYLTQISLGNKHAVLTGNETWHDVATSFDESSILINKRDIAAIQITNGATGEQLTVKEGEDFESILSLYRALDFQPDDSLDGRSGYSYFLRLFDADGNYLQAVTPYTDAVQIDGTLYDNSMNGTSIQLLQGLDALWKSWNNGQ